MLCLVELILTPSQGLLFKDQEGAGHRRDHHAPASQTARVACAVPYLMVYCTRIPIIIIYYTRGVRSVPLGYSALRLKPDGNSVLSTREEKRFFASVPASCARPG